MRILVVGDGQSEIHEVAVANAFRTLGHDVEVFYWGPFFYANRPVQRLLLRAQNKFTWGPAVVSMANTLVAKVCDFGPDLIFIYRGTHVSSSVIALLKWKLPGCKIVGYNNDDPFSSGYPRWYWRHFLGAIPSYDLVLAYRKHNVADYLRAGARRVELLMPWFIAEKDQPVIAHEREGSKYLYDVVFVGHYENDHRLVYIEALLESDIGFKLFGPDWGLAQKSTAVSKLGTIDAVRGMDYVRTLCSARIALCFFSKLNRDTYTRRCFEIPATRTLMLCEYSDDIAEIFKEGEEADFFRTPGEMMSKIRKYLADDGLRESVAEAGYRRVHRDGHDVVSRMRNLLQNLADERGGQNASG